MLENTSPNFNTSKYAVGDLIRIGKDPGDDGWSSRIMLWSVPVEDSRTATSDTLLMNLDVDDLYAIVLDKTHVCCRVVTSKGHVGWLDAYDIWRV